MTSYQMIRHAMLADLRSLRAMLRSSRGYLYSCSGRAALKDQQRALVVLRRSSGF